MDTMWAGLCNVIFYSKCCYFVVNLLETCQTGETLSHTPPSPNTPVTHAWNQTVDSKGLLTYLLGRHTLLKLDVSVIMQHNPQLPLTWLHTVVSMKHHGFFGATDIIGWTTNICLDNFQFWTPVLINKRLQVTIITPRCVLTPAEASELSLMHCLLLVYSCQWLAKQNTRLV